MALNECELDFADWVESNTFSFWEPSWYDSVVVVKLLANGYYLKMAFYLCCRHNIWRCIIVHFVLQWNGGGLLSSKKMCWLMHTALKLIYRLKSVCLCYTLNFTSNMLISKVSLVHGTGLFFKSYLITGRETYVYYVSLRCVESTQRFRHTHTTSSSDVCVVSAFVGTTF